MVKYFCDMCGEELNGEIRGFSISVNGRKVMDEIVVCPKCKKQIYEYFKIKHDDANMEVRPKENIYLHFSDKSNGASAYFTLSKTRHYDAVKTSDGYVVYANDRTVSFFNETFEKLFERID